MMMTHILTFTFSILDRCPFDRQAACNPSLHHEFMDHCKQGEMFLHHLMHTLPHQFNELFVAWGGEYHVPHTLTPMNNWWEISKSERVRSFFDKGTNIVINKSNKPCYNAYAYMDWQGTKLRFCMTGTLTGCHGAVNMIVMKNKKPVEKVQQELAKWCLLGANRWSRDKNGWNGMIDNCDPVWDIQWHIWKLSGAGDVGDQGWGKPRRCFPKGEFSRCKVYLY